jgi:hypothetical protein
MMIAMEHTATPSVCSLGSGTLGAAGGVGGAGVGLGGGGGGCRRASDRAGCCRAAPPEITWQPRPRQAHRERDEGLAEGQLRRRHLQAKPHAGHRQVRQRARKRHPHVGCGGGSDGGATGQGGGAQQRGGGGGGAQWPCPAIPPAASQPPRGPARRRWLRLNTQLNPSTPQKPSKLASRARVVVDERQAAKGPEQDAARRPAHAFRRHAVAQLVHEDGEKQHGADGDEPQQHPPLAGCAGGAVGKEAPGVVAGPAARRRRQHGPHAADTCSVAGAAARRGRAVRPAARTWPLRRQSAAPAAAATVPPPASPACARPTRRAMRPRHAGPRHTTRRSPGIWDSTWITSSRRKVKCRRTGTPNQVPSGRDQPPKPRVSPILAPAPGGVRGRGGGGGRQQRAGARARVLRGERAGCRRPHACAPPAPAAPGCAARAPAARMGRRRRGRGAPRAGGRAELARAAGAVARAGRGAPRAARVDPPPRALRAAPRRTWATAPADGGARGRGRRAGSRDGGGGRRKGGWEGLGR